MVCPVCEKPNPSYNKFCGECGTDMENYVAPEKPKKVEKPVEKKKNVPGIEAL
jgi:predicted amidophosphoribosyltransferase